MSDASDSEGFRLTVTVSDEDSVVALAEAVDEVVDVSIAPDGAPETRGSSIQVDVESLTPKQWEALELAYEAGYYDQPRSVDLETLADELEISKSAVSQRLRAAEGTIVEGVLAGLHARIDE